MKHSFFLGPLMAAILLAQTVSGVGRVHAGPAADHAWSQVVGTYAAEKWYCCSKGGPILAVDLVDKKPFAMEDVIDFSCEPGVLAYVDKERNLWVQTLWAQIDDDSRENSTTRYADVLFANINSPMGQPGELMMRNVATVDCAKDAVCFVTKSGDLYRRNYAYMLSDERLWKVAEGVIDAKLLDSDYEGYDCFLILFSDGRLEKRDYGNDAASELVDEHQGIARSENTFVINGYELMVLDGGTLRFCYTHHDRKLSKDIATNVRRILDLDGSIAIYENRDNTVSVVHMSPQYSDLEDGSSTLDYDLEFVPVSLEGSGVLKGAGLIGDLAYRDPDEVLYLREDGVLRMYSIKTGISQIVANRVVQYADDAFVKQYSGNPVYRYRNKSTGSWIFTVSESEASHLEGSGEWEWECFSHGVPLESDGGNPVHRLFNKISGAHFYTMSETEKNAVLEKSAGIFEYEGIAFHAFGYQAQGTQPVYRFYAPKTASHFFTISEEEKNWIVANVPASDLKFEGVAWYAWPW